MSSSFSNISSAMGISTQGSSSSACVAASTASRGVLPDCLLEQKPPIVDDLSAIVLSEVFDGLTEGLVADTAVPVAVVDEKRLDA